MKVLIIGGVAGGASAAARLRRLDEECEIILFERGEHISFANCGLPYYVGDVIRNKEQLLVQTPEAMKARFRIDVRTGSEVESIDVNGKTVTVHELATGKRYAESYEQLILSPGAAPIKPNIPGLNGENVFTMRNIPDTYALKRFVDMKQPKRAVVVGGGFIGIELAENLVERGVKVTLVELADQVIGPIDFEMAALVHRHLKENGLELYLQDGIQAVRQEMDYSVVELASGEELKTDLIVLGIGVTPENQLAKAAGLAVGVRGGIQVNKTLRTSAPDIYAVGDAIEITDFVNGQPAMIPLAGPANKQGRIAANNICGFYEEYAGTQGTSVLKVFDLTVAFTGNNEKILKRLKIPYETSITHAMSHASYYRGATPISLKIIFSPDTGKVLGAQASGNQGVEKRIDVIATAIRAGMTVYDLEKLELSYAPPYSSAKDPVNMAGYVASNILKKDCQVIHWHDIAKLNKDEVVLIDVRTSVEFSLGTIEGAVNIPVDELRTRLDEIPLDKEVILFCQVGLRGYLAYRILVQHGFQQLRNLSGGYKTYAAAIEEQSNRHLYDNDLFEQESGELATEPVQVLDPAEIQADQKIDASGLQCPGPIMQVYKTLGEMKADQILEVTVTDPAFTNDVTAWCRTTGNRLLAIKTSDLVTIAYIQKKNSGISADVPIGGHDKTLVVFSSDLDKAMASFIIANGAAAMGRKVTMFFTFWGLNILRKTQSIEVKKTFLERMFGIMMPRGSQRLALSKLNMGGVGSKLMRYMMNTKQIAPLEDLMEQAKGQGVRLMACSMSMDVMGIKREELIDGIEIGGVATYLSAAELADTNLFI
ncbi:NADPH-dependent 2 [Sporomusaceae bacterium BoRhaA]|uniref:DsrE/DsrF/DrsH-like family protein n=1 Tax=Pelorhabdus rhamnosifermentans TaxID=2772457 RepID=UPI001C0646A1|nr:DsrE/DsrF/DrsH-like family protein [Pelorhabdus rhamnosifermentans]MBU2699550.1 NADPH-dependent 2 [Pelorhabdus rhamnosifermentans]